MAQGRLGVLQGQVFDTALFGATPPLRPSASAIADAGDPGPAYDVPRDTVDRSLLRGFERRSAERKRLSTAQRRLVERFVEALFDDASDRCQDMVDALFEDCGEPQAVVVLLFEPASRLLGRQWCSDESDFLKVTIAASRMQRLFRQMAAEHPPRRLPDLARCALLAPAPGEQHTFGLAVVDDALARAGWSVDCTGVSDGGEMFRLAATNDYRIIGMSISVARLLPDLVPVLAKLRSRSLNKSVVLMAGGSQVVEDPQSAIDVGFDLVAVDAAAAALLAEAIVARDAERDALPMAAE